MTTTARIVASLARAQQRGADELSAEVDRLRARIEKATKAAKRSARLRASRAPVVPGKTKATKKDAAASRLAVLAEIRVELHRETGGTCAVCALGLPFALMHAHHVLSGPERRTEERADTMAPTHSKCHDALHGKNPRFDQRVALAELLEWCQVTGRAVATESTRRRIGKIDEARATVPVRIAVEGAP
jgi:hypothetical protein